MTPTQESWTIRLAEQTEVARNAENERRKAGRLHLKARNYFEACAASSNAEQQYLDQLRAEAAAALAVTA